MKIMHIIISIHSIKPVPDKAVASAVMCYAKIFILSSVTEELKISKCSVNLSQDQPPPHESRKQFSITALEEIFAR